MAIALVTVLKVPGFKTQFVCGTFQNFLSPFSQQGMGTLHFLEVGKVKTARKGSAPPQLQHFMYSLALSLAASSPTRTLTKGQPLTLPLHIMVHGRL